MRRPFTSTRRWRSGAGGLRISGEAALTALAALCFIGISVWWTLADHRVPGAGDVGRHLLEAIELGELLEDADLLAPLTYESQPPFAYPPLVRTLGAIVVASGLPVHDWAPILLNLIFVPLLAAGCYLTGRLAFGRLGGLLAALFALASPMIMQLFHVYLVDAPLAALIAFATWALLSSRGFSERGQTVLAGAVIGLALLIKPPAPAFLVGPVVVMLARGGWRQWRNIALGVAAMLVVAGPYYVVHLDEYVRLFGEATVASTDPWTKEFGATFTGLDRFGPESLAWYWWAAVNTQYYLPLLVLLGIGLVTCLGRLRREPFVLELVAGLVGGYLAMTFLAVHDARYTLPLVVFVAVIATGWIARAERRWVSAAGVAALAMIVVVNVATASFGALGRVQIQFPGDDPVALTHPGALTILDKRGFVVGEPRTDPLWDEILEAAHDAGARTARLQILEFVSFGTDMAGFDVIAHEHGLLTEDLIRLNRDPDRTLLREVQEEPDLVVTIWWTSDVFWTEAGYPAPCAKIEEGISNPGNPTIPIDEGIPISVSVEREINGRLTRWCGFPGGEPASGRAVPVQGPA